MRQEQKYKCILSAHLFVSQGAALEILFLINYADALSLGALTVNSDTKLCNEKLLRLLFSGVQRVGEVLPPSLLPDAIS